MSKRKPVVWVIIHCEYFQRNDEPDSEVPPITDEMVFHVASSLRAAEKYVRARHVMPHSWWKVERRLVDEPDFDANDMPERHYYNCRGQPRKSEPHAAALGAFKKWQDQEAREQDSRSKKG